MLYRVTSIVSLAAGVTLGLTPDQAAPRQHALTPSKRKGCFDTIAPVQFKVGEQLEYHGELSKALAERMAPVGADKG